MVARSVQSNPVSVVDSLEQWVQLFSERVSFQVEFQVEFEETVVAVC